MTTYKQISFPVILCVMWILLNGLNVSNIPEGITLSLSKGDSKQLSNFFYSNIEMTILDKEGVYSKAQAEQVLKKFFEKNPPKGFRFIHKGGKENSRYTIGEYSSQTKKFRITIYLKNTKNNKPLIHQLIIQYDNN